MICGREDVAPSRAKQSCVAKIVITSCAEEGSDWQPHIRNRPRRETLATYAEAGCTGKAALDWAKAVALMQEKLEVCLDFFRGFDCVGGRC